MSRKIKPIKLKWKYVANENAVEQVYNRIFNKAFENLKLKTKLQDN